MANFRFYHPMEVRYGDVDAQRHVNNAAFFSYMETARSLYLQHLGLWDGKDFMTIGIILAETTCTYRAPAAFGQALRVGVRAARLGTKSFEIHHTIEDADTGQEIAGGKATLVAYDYHLNQGIPIPDNWRRAMAAFEGLTPAESGLPD